MLRKALPTALLCALLLFAAGPGSAAPGDADDPAVSKSYVDKFLVQGLTDYAETAALGAFAGYRAALGGIYDRLAGLDTGLGGPGTAADAVMRSVGKSVYLTAARRTVIDYERGDAFIGSDGCMFRVLSGKMAVKGVLIDLIDGDVLSISGPAPAEHLLAAEDGASLTALTDGQIEIFGRYRYVPPPRERFTDAAEALRDMGLLGGTTQGFLQRQPATRLEGFMLLIYLRGERETAAAYTGPLSALDVPAWARNSVAFAYNKGYTGGTSPTTFSPDYPMSADDFATITLDLLGYSRQTDFNWRTALDFAVGLGLYTPAERDRMREYFSRDELFFMEYKTLSMRFKGSSKTVLDSLIESGAVDAAAAEAAMSRVAWK
jgi:hypothetical protein